LGAEGRDAECGDEEEAADEGPEMHACDGSRGGCAEFNGNCDDYFMLNVRGALARRVE
jgi:hypothetical protein